MRAPSAYASCLLIAIATLCTTQGAGAQTIADELRADVRRSAGMYYALPVTETTKDTPPPAGKKPFYINHYGCSSPYYLDQPGRYTAPNRTLARADSLGMLSRLGRNVLRKVALLRKEAHNRTNELTEAGKLQARKVAKQMTERLPEMFTDNSYVDGRSIVQNHCLLTLGEATVQVSRAHQPMHVDCNGSHSYQQWMNPPDDKLEALRQDTVAIFKFTAFVDSLEPDFTRLAKTLFNDDNYVKHINAAALGRQLFDLACTTQYSESVDDTSLLELFTPDEIHRLWKIRNALAYIRYGGCTLNGGYQPYVQRSPLWILLHMGDSIMTLDNPVVHLRYTHQNVLMSLVCLLELDGFGVKTACLDSIETLGWADYRIAPFGGSIMMIHYRSDKNDPDPMVRVLLNGREAQLPIPTDYPPYYHWQDVKRYYLRKLYIYERERNYE